MSAQQQQTVDWTEIFLEHLPYPCPIRHWEGGQSQHALDDWKRLGFDVDILRVSKLQTRHPGFHDYDLAAIIRARSSSMRRGTGCDGDVVVDAQIGLHLSNYGILHPKMWYGRNVACVTLRCHEGHAKHFRTWICPEKLVKESINGLILERIGKRSLIDLYADEARWLRNAYDSLMSRLPVW